MGDGGGFRAGFGMRSGMGRLDQLEGEPVELAHELAELPGVVELKGEIRDRYHDERAGCTCQRLQA